MARGPCVCHLCLRGPLEMAGEWALAGEVLNFLIFTGYPCVKEKNTSHAGKHY